MTNTNNVSAAFNQFSSLFLKNAGIFSKNIEKMQSEFSDSWQAEFSEFIQRVFDGNEEKLTLAIQGYCKFCLESMRLQKHFNLTQKYRSSSYQDALTKVYLNADYMREIYLPGILLSNYLWPHHYRQLQFYRERFLPILKEMNIAHAYDVGTGTGFFSVELLRGVERLYCHGLDISPSSREFTLDLIRKSDLENRFKISNIDITHQRPEPYNCLQCIEILEHLEDPQTFLIQLRKLLSQNGIGFITAAITAAHEDHIYLYWEPEDVIKQLETAGFKVLEQYCEQAYPAMPDEFAPRVCGFIVR